MPAKVFETLRPLMDGAALTGGGLTVGAIWLGWFQSSLGVLVPLLMAVLTGLRIWHLIKRRRNDGRDSDAP